MDLNTLLPVIAALACPIGMGVMMWLMSKNMNGQDERSKHGDHSPISGAERLAVLREQRQILEAEIAETARLVELEAQRDALLRTQTSPSENAEGSAVQGAAGR